jgi:type I restriction enzyme, R subunit
MKTTDTSEKSLEVIIEKHLVEVCQYRQSFSNDYDYDRDQCINKRLLFEFIKSTQPTSYETILKRGEDEFLKRLTDQARQRGIIDVPRKGVKDLDLAVHLYHKQPASDLNQKVINLYSANIFSVTRQLHYSLSNNNSLDMVIFINGLPLITFELKKSLDRQNVKHAIKQYQQDRDPKEPLFQFARCMVHFAVGPDLVYMSTHLVGGNAAFLSFNKGLDDGEAYPKDRPRGAGNPNNDVG